MLDSVKQMIDKEPNLLIQFLRIANALYRENGPQEIQFKGITFTKNDQIFTDKEYDDFKKQEHFVEPQMNAQNRSKVKQQYAFGTLEKFTEINLDKYKKRCEKENINEFILTPKYDGIGMRVYFGELCLTRYDKEYGLDISYKCKNLLKKYKIPKDCILRGELMTFKEHEGFSSKRNYVSGMVNNELPFPDDIEYIVYEYLPVQKQNQKLTYEDMLQNIYKCGFKKHLTQKITLKDITQEKLLAFKNKIDKNILVDGVVVRPNDKEHSFENREKPRFQIGYKFQGQLYENTIQKITWTIKQGGYLQPTVWLNDITQIDGINIIKATGVNFNYLFEQNLLPDSKCNVSLKIVPRIEGLKDNKLTKEQFAQKIIPEKCPCCGGPIIQNEGNVSRFQCANYYQKCYKYILFPKIKKILNIKGCGEKRIQKAIDEDKSFYEFIKQFSDKKPTDKQLFLILSDNVDQKTIDQKYNKDELIRLQKLYKLIK